MTDVDAIVLAALAVDEGLADLADALPGMVLPAAHLVATAPGGGAAGRSRLGGSPVLAADQQWPQAATGEPLVFFAQLDLAGVGFLAGEWGAPRDGTLAFFCEWDPETGEAYGPAEIIWTPPDAATREHAPPYDDVLGEVAVTPAPVTTLPDAGSTALAPWGLGPYRYERREAYHRLWERAGAPPWPRHQLLGHPELGQHDVLASLPRDGDGPDPDEPFRLLLQIDDDPDGLGASFGDGGMLWFYAPEADLRAGSFARVRAASESS